MPETSSPETKPLKGRIADSLTLARAILTPVIVLLILTGWPELYTALYASMIFAFAALTDILDDLIGGSAQSSERKFGWFDDISDTLLCTGVLATMLYVIAKADMMSPLFAIPAAALIGREVLVGLVKGYELSRRPYATSRLGLLKTALTMLAICTLLASPWLTALYDNWRATHTSATAVYGEASTHIWIIGQILLWLAACISVYTGFKILFRKDNLQ